MPKNRKGKVQDIYSISQSRLDDILTELSKDETTDNTKTKICKDHLGDLIDWKHKEAGICPIYNEVKFSKDCDQEAVRTFYAKLGLKPANTFLEELRYEINDYSIGHLLVVSPENYLLLHESLEQMGSDISKYTNLKVKGSGIFFESLDPGKEIQVGAVKWNVGQLVKHFLNKYASYFINNLSPAKFEDKLEFVSDLNAILDYLITTLGYNDKIFVDAGELVNVKDNLLESYQNMEEKHKQDFKLIELGISKYCNGGPIIPKKYMIKINDPCILLDKIRKEMIYLRSKVSESLASKKSVKPKSLDEALHEKLRQEEEKSAIRFNKKQSQKHKTAYNNNILTQQPAYHTQGIANTVAMEFFRLPKDQREPILDLINKQLKHVFKENYENLEFYPDHYSNITNFTLKYLGALVVTANFYKKKNNVVGEINYRKLLEHEINKNPNIFFGDFTKTPKDPKDLLRLALTGLKQHDRSVNLSQVQESYKTLSTPAATGDVDSMLADYYKEKQLSKHR